MPRYPRQFEVGGIYHIINRGVEKRKIFLKNQDYSRFILGLEFFNKKDAYIDIWDLVAPKGVPGTPFAMRERLEKERTKEYEPLVEILAFVLMSNHFHLILKEIKKGGISKFMQKMGGYSKYFNKQYDRVGPLFQGRYKAVPIKTHSQLITIFNYVHTNPVELVEPGWKDIKVKNKKNAIDYLRIYKWSSFHDYVGRARFPEATQRKFYLDILGQERGCRIAVEDWIKFKAENTDLDKKLLE